MQLASNMSTVSALTLNGLVLLAEKAKYELRLVKGFHRNDFLMFYAAEFNVNKNHLLLIEAIASIKDEMPNARLLLAGDGPLLKECQDLAKSKGVSEMIDFLGYQDNIDDYLRMADLAVASSKREGLPVNVMEAMASGLPILATLNRGHSELIKHDYNGYLVPQEDVQQYASRMLQFYRSRQLCKQMGIESLNRIKDYSLDQVGLEMKKIYARLMTDKSIGGRGSCSIM